MHERGFSGPQIVRALIECFPCRPIH